MIGFKKKTPKEWTFGDKPVVKWLSTNKTKMDITTVCKLILTQILNVTDVELIIVTNDRIISKFDSNDLEMQAILQAIPERHQYRLSLHSRISPSTLPLIICHEMIHLKQYDKGELKLNKNGAIWKGEFYKKETPYFERPWEIEANAEMKNIEKKMKELYYE